MRVSIRATTKGRAPSPCATVLPRVLCPGPWALLMSGGGALKSREHPTVQGSALMGRGVLCEVSGAGAGCERRETRNREV